MNRERFDERRRHPRRVEPLSLRSADTDFFQRILDISIGGLRVLSSGAHPVGHQIPMQLRMPGGQVLSVTTEVAWIRRVMDGPTATNEIGLRFLDLTDGDRILIASIL